MAVDIAAIANAVVENYFGSAVRLTFENRTLFDFQNSPYNLDDPDSSAPRGILGIQPPEGGVSDRFSVLASTDQAAEEFTEYAPLGAAGNDTWVNAQPGVISVWAPVLTTGFAMDAAKGPEDLVNVIEQNLVTAFGKIADKINSVALGSTAKGIVGAIDDTTTYGGLSRTTYAAWQSVVTAAGGALTLAQMENTLESMQSGNRNASTEGLPEIWCERNQMTNYRRLAGAVGNAEMIQHAQPTGGHLDLGVTTLAFNGMMFRHLPGLNNQTMLFPYLGRSREQIYFKEKRSLQVEFSPYSGDGTLLKASWRGMLVVKQPNLCGKIETITA